MKPQAYFLLLSIFLSSVSSTAMAGSTIQCPDLSRAKQVLDCPQEAEVKRMFKISCDFEHDPKAKRPEKCDSYAEFKRRKYTALWESADGEFVGYVTCAVPPAEIGKAKPISVSVSRKNNLYKISCNYEGRVKFTQRTRSKCRIPGAKDTSDVARAKCDADPSDCKVVCD